MKWLRIAWGLLAFLHGVVYAESIVIGVDQSNPPLATKTDNASHFMGFEIDIMNEICTRLKLTCTYQSVIGDRIISALETGQIDFAVNTIIIPKFRLYGLILSLPYLPSTAQFLALKNAKISEFSEIPNYTIGVRLGAFQVNIDSDMYIKHVFKKKLKIKGYESTADLIAALNDHEIDAAFFNQFAANYWYTANSNMYKYIGKPTQIGYGYGIMSTPKYQQLMLSINETIQKIMADGTYDMIYQRYLTNFQ